MLALVFLVRVSHTDWVITSFLLGTFILNLYAVALVLARAKIFGTQLYRPMLWNIWLSVAPILVLMAGAFLMALLSVLAPWLTLPVMLVFGAVWLLLLPNASYLITELNLSHRKDSDPVPLWYDIILVLSLAMSGVFNAVINVFLAHVTYASTRYGDTASSLLKPDAVALVAIVLLLLGFGMYLGRYLRLNSWDIRSPRRLWSKVWEHFRVPQHLRNCLGFTLTHAVFLGVIYLITAGTVILALEMVEQARLGA